MNEDRFSRIAALKPATTRVDVEPRGYLSAIPEGADDLRHVGPLIQSKPEQCSGER